MGIDTPKLKAEAPARPKTTYKKHKADKILESHIEKSAPAPCVAPFNIIKGQAGCSGSPCFHWFGEDVLCADPPFWTRIPPGSPPDPPVDPPRSTRATYATRNQYVCLLDDCATIGDTKNHICMSFGCHRLWRNAAVRFASYGTTL